MSKIRVAVFAVAIAATSLAPTGVAVADSARQAERAQRSIERQVERQARTHDRAHQRKARTALRAAQRAQERRAEAPVAEPHVDPVSAPSEGAGGRLACIRSYEQGQAGYATNTGNGYSGAYQFLQQTWDSVAKRRGATHLVGVRPHNASPADQDAQAANLLAIDGIGQWGKKAQANC